MLRARQPASNRVGRVRAAADRRRQARRRRACLPVVPVFAEGAHGAPVEQEQAASCARQRQRAVRRAHARGLAARAPLGSHTWRRVGRRFAQLEVIRAIRLQQVLYLDVLRGRSGALRAGTHPAAEYVTTRRARRGASHGSARGRDSRVRMRMPAASKRGGVAARTLSHCVRALATSSATCASPASGGGSHSWVAARAPPPAVGVAAAAAPPAAAAPTSSSMGVTRLRRVNTVATALGNGAPRPAGRSWASWALGPESASSDGGRCVALPAQTQTRGG